MTHCIAIPALADNYIWLLRESETSDQTYVFDPSEAAPVLDYLSSHQLQLAGILLTHHHWDHIGGVDEILNSHDVPIYGPSSIKSVTHPVSDGDELILKRFKQSFKVLGIPGHTLDHLAYHGQDSLFCGDTLFSAGCGKIFEGTPTQMLDSLHKLAALPEQTKIYCAHEYTLSNLTFASLVEPTNRAINEQIISTKQRLAKTGCSLPSTLAIEKNINPFLRCTKENVIAAASHYASKPLKTELDVFTEIRQWKNNI